MKFSKFTADTVAELLVHLADHESFASLKGLKHVSKSDVQTVLLEIAGNLKESGAQQPLMRKSQLGQKDLAQKTTQAISKLTPKEEEILLKSFRIS